MENQQNNTNETALDKLSSTNETVRNETVLTQFLWELTQRTCNTPTAVLACISVVLNCLCIVTFLKERKTNKKLLCGSAQLLILAVSEVAIGLTWVLGFVIRLLIENQLSSKNLTAFRFFRSYGWIIGSINRMLTVYIVFTRARIVWRWVP
jgi:hypothetical protein